jgi:hydrogenase expression/formation protein HypC
MCLGIPGRIVAITHPDHKLGMVDVCGVRRQINLACVIDDAQAIESYIGAWVLVHVGFAMSLIDEQEAELTLDLLRQLGEAQQELDSMRGATV